ncbi:MAG: GNAT family N-acetyltransferase [Hellea sp.]|nr:GNAT family N-acetyltransferase [Hellea sp.]
MALTHRIATQADIPIIMELMEASMARLLPDVLTPEQVAKSNASMGLDTQLLDDQTYFLIFDGHTLVGCGGWSRRRTLYGGNHTRGRDDALADPKFEAAKIRAMYTHPDHVRRGIGSLIMELGESAAKAEGFETAELGATASGILLYEKCGYEVIEDLSEPDENGVVVPIILMRKPLI